MGGGGGIHPPPVRPRIKNLMGGGIQSAPSPPCTSEGEAWKVYQF